MKVHVESVRGTRLAGMPVTGSNNVDRAVVIMDDRPLLDTKHAWTPHAAMVVDDVHARKTIQMKSDRIRARPRHIEFERTLICRLGVLCDFRAVNRKISVVASRVDDTARAVYAVCRDEGSRSDGDCRH